MGSRRARQTQLPVISRFGLLPTRRWLCGAVEVGIGVLSSWHGSCTPPTVDNAVVRPRDFETEPEVERVRHGRVAHWPLRADGFAWEVPKRGEQGSDVQNSPTSVGRSLEAESGMVEQLPREYLTKVLELSPGSLDRFMEQFREPPVPALFVAKPLDVAQLWEAMRDVLGAPSR